MNNLPKILIIALKRLLYNKDSSTKIKNNENLEFPFTLNLSNYNYLNDTNNLNNDIITEYNLKEIVIYEYKTDIYRSLLNFIKVNKSEKWIKLSDKFIGSFDIFIYKYENNSNASMIILKKILILKL